MFYIKLKVRLNAFQITCRSISNSASTYSFNLYICRLKFHFCKCLACRWFYKHYLLSPKHSSERAMCTMVHVEIYFKKCNFEYYVCNVIPSILKMSLVIVGGGFNFAFKEGVLALLNLWTEFGWTLSWKGTPVSWNIGKNAPITTLMLTSICEI